MPASPYQPIAGHCCLASPYRSIANPCLSWQIHYYSCQTHGLSVLPPPPILHINQRLSSYIYIYIYIYMNICVLLQCRNLKLMGPRWCHAHTSAMTQWHVLELNTHDLNREPQYLGAHYICMCNGRDAESTRKTIEDEVDA
jgi:hypothetical protein